MQTLTIKDIDAAIDYLDSLISEKIYWDLNCFSPSLRDEIAKERRHATVAIKALQVTRRIVAELDGAPTEGEGQA